MSVSAPTIPCAACACLQWVSFVVDASLKVGRLKVERSVQGFPPLPCV